MTRVICGCKLSLLHPFLCTAGQMATRRIFVERVSHNATKHHRTPVGSGCGPGRHLRLHPSGLAGEHHSGAMCTSVVAL
ncbi:hypothetical protein XENOCAPTIV_003372 [Xenoophorus captivus]|uniref:Secreted protein n=1 Tax=Xenoophorus captivus TaxID=1517983 RepID=A0ABV0RWZ8_9TELE